MATITFNRQFDNLLSLIKLNPANKVNFVTVFANYIITDIVNKDVLAYQDIPTTLGFEFDATSIINELNNNIYKRMELVDFFLFNHEGILASEKKKKSGLSLEGTEHRGWSDTNRSI